jgi:hypothetical protein
VRCGDPSRRQRPAVLSALIKPLAVVVAVSIEKKAREELRALWVRVLRGQDLNL